MDKALANAMQRRAELRRELEDVETFITLYQRFSSDTIAGRTFSSAAAEMATMVAASDTYPAAHLEQMWTRGESNQEHAAPGESTKTKKGLSREELKPHIEAVIREAGKPLTRGVLLRKLDQRGTPVGGKADRAKNMGTIMWRLKDDFINLPGYGYWIKGEPCPAADYDPELTDRDSDFDL